MPTWLISFLINPKTIMIVGAAICVLYVKGLWQDAAVREAMIEVERQTAQAKQEELARQRDAARASLDAAQMRRVKAEGVAAALQERADEYAKRLASGEADKCVADPEYDARMRSIK